MNPGLKRVQLPALQGLALSGTLLLAVLLAACAAAPAGPPAGEAPASPTPIASPPVTSDAPSAPGEAAAPAASPTTSSTRTPPLPVCTPAPAPKPKPRPRRKPAVEETVAPKPAPSSQASEPNNRSPSGQANVRTLPAGSVLAVLGKKVWGPNGDDLGRVIDVLIDPASGAIRSAVIDFGGFLGVGNRKIAVDWTLLEFKAGADGKQVRLLLNRTQVLAAPEYRDSADRAAEVIAPAGNNP